jgi:hypothetical protein
VNFVKPVSQLRSVVYPASAALRLKAAHPGSSTPCAGPKKCVTTSFAAMGQANRLIWSTGDIAVGKHTQRQISLKTAESPVGLVKRGIAADQPGWNVQCPAKVTARCAKSRQTPARCMKTSRAVGGIGRTDAVFNVAAHPFYKMA